MKKPTTETPNSPAPDRYRNELDSFERKNAEAEANFKYESALIPLLWLLLPFILILIYGFYS